MGHGYDAHGHSLGAFCGGVAVDAHVLSWGAASYGASELLVAFHADAASVQVLQEGVCGEAGADGQKVSAGPVGHLRRGGGDRAAVQEEQGAQCGWRGGMAVVHERCGLCEG